MPDLQGLSGNDAAFRLPSMVAPDGPTSTTTSGARTRAALRLSLPWYSKALKGRWPRRLLVSFFILAALAVIWSTNSYLTERFTETTRNRAEVRQALYNGQMLSELQRTSVVPLLLARDPELISALNNLSLIHI